MPERWQVLAPDLLNWRQVDGHWLIHDRGCSRIHVLDALTAAVLGQLEVEVATADALCDALLPQQAEVERAQFAENMALALKNLAAAGLIERVLP